MKVKAPPRELKLLSLLFKMSAMNQVKLFDYMVTNLGSLNTKTFGKAHTTSYNINVIDKRV